MSRISHRFLGFVACAVIAAISFLPTPTLLGQSGEADLAEVKRAAYEKEFAAYLSGSKLTGIFTVDGKPINQTESESYEIKSAKKIEGEENLWEIVSRIQYGDKDFEMPIEIKIEWIGKTPVMVLESVTIPGMGTFSARVLFHDKKYAGTWKHDTKGGHIIGKVEKLNK